jgi:hypothetical protein
MSSNKIYGPFRTLSNVDALLHKSDISQLSSESFNQMIDMISELFIIDPETA